nr:U3 small nucleolar RNA-associated protein 25 homolog [Aegilops tauschii subsp. strangulata]
MPPRCRVRSEPFLTPERRLELLEKIRARREAWIAAGLPPDEVDLKEELEEEEEDEDEEEEQEEGDEPGEEGVGDADDGDLQAEQQAILDSLQLVSAAEARRRCRHEMEAQEAADEAEMFTYMDEVEQGD